MAWNEHIGKHIGDPAYARKRYPVTKAIRQ